MVLLFVSCYCSWLYIFFMFSGAIQYVKVGGTIRFNPSLTLLPGSTFTWKFKGVGGNVIRMIEFDIGQDESPKNPLFKNRAVVDKNTAELTLKDLTVEHNGLYFFEINNKEQDLKFTLQVMGK